MTLWRNKRHKVWVDDGFNFVIEAIKTNTIGLSAKLKQSMGPVDKAPPTT